MISQIGAGFYTGAGIPKDGPCKHCRKLREHHWLGANDTAFCDTRDLGTHVLFGPIVGERQFEPERVNTFVECGCCGAYHRTDFQGDCREDSERYYDLPDDAEVVYLG